MYFVISKRRLGGLTVLIAVILIRCLSWMMPVLD